MGEDDIPRMSTLISTAGPSFLFKSFSIGNSTTLESGIGSMLANVAATIGRTNVLNLLLISKVSLDSPITFTYATSRDTLSICPYTIKMNGVTPAYAAAERDQVAVLKLFHELKINFS